MTPTRITVERRTRETDVRVALRPGTGTADVTTTVPFLDHMLVALARYGALDLEVRATGDLRHHLVEDVALALGEALARAFPPTGARYAERTVPMDDALVQGVLDAGGRPFYEGPLPSQLYDHFMRSTCGAAGFTFHLRVLRGQDRHHIVEAAFKAFGFCLRDAMRDAGAVFSTKGAIAMEIA